MNRYLWSVVAGLIGIVVALRPPETPPTAEKKGDDAEVAAKSVAREKRMQMAVFGGPKVDLPPGASDWFRSTLMRAKVIELLDPLTQQLPWDPPVHFYDGDRVYVLHESGVTLTDYARTTGRKFLRSYEHEAFRRIHDRIVDIDYASNPRKCRDKLFEQLRLECRAAASGTER